MSYVNKVSKSNVEYDIQDARTFVLDLGDISSLMDNEEFQKTIAYADLESLVNADVGIVKLLYEQTEAVCRVVARGGNAGSGYMAMATLFMQSQSNEYSTFVIQCMGSSGQAYVRGSMVQQEIGGGSGGSIPMFSAQLTDWQEDGGIEMAEFSVGSEDYDICANNDVAFVKLLDYTEQDSYVMQKIGNIYEGGDYMYLFSMLNENDLYMAMVMRQDDGEGGYIYQGMAMRSELSSLIDTLKFYHHYVQIDMGGGQGATIEYVNANDSEVEDLGSLISQIGSDATYNIQIILNGQKYSIVGVNYDANNDAEKIVQINGTSLAEISLSSFTGGTFTDAVNTIHN